MHVKIQAWVWVRAGVVKRVRFRVRTRHSFGCRVWVDSIVRV